MTKPAFYTRSWFLLLALLGVGTLLLVPGLGSFGLWEPPDTWETVHQRRADGSLDAKVKKDRYSRPRSELLLAEQARRDVAGGSETKKATGEKAGRAGKGTKDQVDQLPKRPPLHRSLITLGFRVLGVSEGAGRLPLALLALLALALTFLVLTRLFDRWTGLLGGLVLVGLPAFVLQARQLTSEMATITCALMAVGGLGLWVSPSARRPWWTLPLGLLGLVGGYYARGAVVGVIIPSAAVLIAMVAGYRLYAPASGSPEADHAPPRWRFWTFAGVLAAVTLGLTIAAWIVLMSHQRTPVYSAFLGETPIATNRALNFFGLAKSNPTALAVFDVMVKQVGYAAFPWVALLPLGLAVLVRRSATVAPPAGPAPAGEVDHQFGRLLIGAWILVSLLVGTYWILRFGDLSYPALPALAAAIAVLLRDLSREVRSPLRIAAVALAVAVVAILVRDFGSFPEALVSTHIHYQLRYPAEVSLKWPMRLVAVPFVVGIVALLVGRASTAPLDRLPGLLARPGLGLARMLGLPDEPRGESQARPVQGALLLILVAVAGGGLSWILQRRPHAGIIILGGLLALVVLPVLHHLMLTLVDPVLHGLQVLWRVVQGRKNEPLDVLIPVGEVDAIHNLWRRFVTAHVATKVLLALPGLTLAIAYLVRVLGRMLVLLLVGLAGLPMVVYALLRARGERDHWPRVDRAIIAFLVMVSLSMSAWLAFHLVPRLSHHFSYKSIIETYNQSKDKKRPQPLALWKVASRSPVFYTKGPLLQSAELRKRYPHKRGRGPLLQYLEQGWTNGKGRRHERVYAIIPVSTLGTLDRDAHASEPPVPYYVLDDRNSFYLLVSNRLGRVRRGGKWVKERDRNPLRRVVLDQPPKIECRGKRNTVCRRLQVELAEQKSAREPSLVLVGAHYPKVVSPGKKFDVVLFFEVRKKIRGKYKVFIHIDGRGNRILGDHEPVGGKYGTPLWLPGRWVVDRFTIPSTASSTVSTPRGRYTLYAGLFQGDRRMQVLSGVADKTNRIIVGHIRVGGGRGCGR